MPVPTKAVVVQKYGPPSVLKHVTKVETRDPEVGEVLIALKAAGVNPLDTYTREGSFSGSFPPPPYVPGCDGAGTVAALGPGVDKFQVGDPVYVTKATTGTYATHCIARTNHVSKDIYTIHSPPIQPSTHIYTIRHSACRTAFPWRKVPA